MSEIKETVANQVQAVKDTFDWREQFKKRPVAWSAGALGVGFVTGYKVAGAFKHPSTTSYLSPDQYSYTPQKKIIESKPERDVSWSAEDRDEGPGLVDRFKDSPVYSSLSKEASSLGNELVKQLSSTAHLVVLPFLLTKFKEMVGLDRLEKATSISSAQRSTMGRRTDLSEPERTSRPESTPGHS